MHISKSELQNIIKEEIDQLLSERKLDITAYELAHIENDPFYLKRFQDDPEQHPEYETKIQTYVQDPEINKVIFQTLRLADNDIRKIRIFLQALNRLLKTITIRVDDAPTTGGGLEEYPSQLGY